MSDALDLIYYMLQKFLDTVFSLYLFNGVSLGMIFVSGFIFTVMLRYLIAIPRVRVGGRPGVSSSNEKKSD